MLIALLPGDGIGPEVIDEAVRVLKVAAGDRLSFEAAPVGGAAYKAATDEFRAILAYLVIAGWPPPAQRSAITAAVAALAVLLDRRALTLHSLAVAALIVLAFQPEAVSQPGFQMVECLV